MNPFECQPKYGDRPKQGFKKKMTGLGVEATTLN